MLVFSSDGLSLAPDALLTTGQLVAVEGGLAFACLRLLVDNDLLGFCKCYFDAIEGRRRYPIRHSDREGQPEFREHTAVSEEVTGGRERFQRTLLGPVTMVRLSGRLESNQLPALGDVTFGGRGDGSRSTMRKC